MIRDEIKALIMEILVHADYDLSKAYDPETAEEPEYAESEMERLIDVTEDFLKKQEKKQKKASKKKK